VSHFDIFRDGVGSRDIIDACEENFGRGSREFSFWKRLTYLRVPKPFWLYLDKSDKLMTLFEHVDDLLREGVIVMGHIIQVNQWMFSRGMLNCPGEVIYSLTDRYRVDPMYLGEVAHALHELKGTEPADRELAPIAEYLTDELIRVFGLVVPAKVSPDFRCQISTTLFVRKHLQKKRVCAPLLPMLVSPREPNVAMPLPAKYWPRNLVAWWEDCG